MAAQMELEPITRQLPIKQQTPMDLLNIALTNGAAIDVIERLAALQEKAIKWDAEIQFNEALNAAQSELGRIAPDLNNAQTKSKYASYAALDRAIRPIYTKHGFSLSFDTTDCPLPETVRAVCYVSHRAGHSRRYQIDIPADGKGAKGGDVMTKTHATGAGMAYGMRYMLKNIFNIAIGEADTDGNQMSGLSEKLEWIANCKTLSELKRIFDQAYTEAEELGDKAAMFDLIKANSGKRKELTPKEQPK
jgi:hypothetical protein